jgi:hypothetical protein
MGRSTPYSRIRSPCSSSMVARLSISHFRRRQIARRLVSSADRHRDERHHPRPRRRARIGARAIGRQLERVPRCLYTGSLKYAVGICVVRRHSGSWQAWPTPKFPDREFGTRYAQYRSAGRSVSFLSEDWSPWSRSCGCGGQVRYEGGVFVEVSLC